VNRSLNRQLFQLKHENEQIQELYLENQRLRQMLNFVGQKEYHYIPTLVINKSAGQTLNSITLDKGIKQGLKRGAPVLSASGIVGRIVEINDHSALCQLILDRQMGTAVKIQRNRIDGILHWDSGDLCRLDGILHSMEVLVGDTIITSGMGGVFPKGFNVGTVTSVNKEREKLFQLIYVKPFTDFHRLEEVFVLSQ
jgi:rod shape-determining protein MreC